VGSSGIPEWSLPAPSNLTTTAVSLLQIDLQWQGSLGADGYEIERSVTTNTDYSLLATVGSNVTSYSDTGLSQFTTYYYRIRAFNTIGDRSAWSNETSATTPILDAPSSLTATAISFYQVNLSWIDNADEENGFELERSIPGGTYSLVVTLPANTTFYSDTSASPSLTNYYRIRDFMTVGTTTIYSNYSNTVSALTFDWAWVPTTWTDIAAGGLYSLALTSNGNLWSWGRNDYGQLGSGDYVDRIFPSPIASDWDYNVFANIAAVATNKAAGVESAYTIACKTDGTIWGWGANGVGQLGLGETWTPEAPVQIGSDSDWSILTAGWVHSLGLKTTGTLWAWGDNTSGQLGLQGAVPRNTPTQVTTSTDWAMIAAGYLHTLGLKSTGTLWAWGWNFFGQLGRGDTLDRNTPSQVETQTDWYAVAAGSGYTLGLKTTGTLWAWGYNDYGQLGLGDTINRTTPTQVTTSTDWSMITVGWTHTIGLKTNGTLWAWGRNNYAQLGDGTTDIYRTTPIQVTTETDWSTLAAGDSYGLGLKTNGTLWVWGYNGYGQLGLGDTIDKLTPTMMGE